MSKPQKFKTLRGFRDFPPEDLQRREYLFSVFRSAAERFGYREYDGPPLEALELYTDKSGDEIVDQLYAFTDKGGREVALRPEMTPSLARILADRSRSLPKPIRWFSIPQLFRYERTQKGRLREHFQWNVDLVGEDAIDADAEILAVALTALRDLGLGPYRIRARISDRRLLAALLGAKGLDPETHEGAYRIIDKVEREGRDRAVERFGTELGVAESLAGEILELLELSDPAELRSLAPDASPLEEAIVEVEALLEVARDLGFGEYLSFDLTIVRGLAYYTGPVFEIFDRAGEYRAICGGGRYDSLLERVGGEALPAVGFGMGDVVVGELLDELDLLPDLEPRVDYFIVSITGEERALGRRIAASLRARGHSVALPLRDGSVGKQFKAAASEGAAQVIILGPDEVGRGEGVIRSMADGREETVALDTLTGEE